MRHSLPCPGPRPLTLVLPLGSCLFLLLALCLFLLHPLPLQFFHQLKILPLLFLLFLWIRRHPNRWREEGFWREERMTFQCGWGSHSGQASLGAPVSWVSSQRSLPGLLTLSSHLGCCGTHRGQTWWLFPKFGCALLEWPEEGSAQTLTLTPSPHLLCCFHFRHSTLWPCSPWKNGKKYRSEAKGSLWEGVPLVVPQGLGPGLAQSKHLINC